MPLPFTLLAGISLGALSGVLLLVLLDLFTRNIKQQDVIAQRVPSGCWSVLLGGWVGSSAGVSCALDWHGLQAEPALVLLGSGLLLALLAAAIAWTETGIWQEDPDRPRSHFLDSLLQLSVSAPLPWAVGLIAVGLARLLQ